MWLVKLAGIDSVEEAEAFRGLTLGMLADDRPDLDGEDEFYVQDLIGMKARLILVVLAPCVQPTEW